MKLFYIIILLMCVFKSSVTRPLNASNIFNISTAAQELVNCYQKEYDLLAQEMSTKVKIITDEILTDEVVHKTNTPLMQTLKKNLTEFQKYFPHFKRFHYDESLVLDFSDLIKIFYYPSRYENNTDFLYVQQLLKKLGYNEIRDRHTSKLKTFFEQTFLTRFAELQVDIAKDAKYITHDSEVLKWIGDLKKCEDYECFLVDFDNYKKRHASFFEFIFQNIFVGLTKTVIINADTITVFAHDVLKDPKISQLSLPVGQQLIKNLQSITYIPDSFTEFLHIYFYHVLSYQILYKFDDYASISQKDRQLITDIFNDHGYRSLHLNNKEELAKYDYITQYESIKATLSPNKLAQLERLSEVVDRFTNASSLQERADALKNYVQVAHELSNIK